MKFPGIFILSIYTAVLFSCKTEEIILHGDISGIITDAITSQPLPSAEIKLNPSDISTDSGLDGSYLIKSLTPGGYEIAATKSGYGIYTKYATVGSAETRIVDFPLNPLPEISVPGLDFGPDSTSRSFTISNPYITKLSYVITTSQNWIDVLPPSGDITNGTRKITVTIDRTGLPDGTIKESINIAVYSRLGKIGDIPVGVYLNGVLDQDGNYYRIVKIYTQTWMAENLNTGIPVISTEDQTDNGIIEKYVAIKECGGLYQWSEMMQYNPPDDKVIGTTQGICPVGWHIPTPKEWQALADNIGGAGIAGKKLKEAGYIHWREDTGNPEDVAGTDNYGFTALPDGFRNLDGIIYKLRWIGVWWTSASKAASLANLVEMTYASSELRIGGGIYLPYALPSLSTVMPEKKLGCSVRCVKDE